MLLLHRSSRLIFGTTVGLRLDVPSAASVLVYTSSLPASASVGEEASVDLKNVGGRSGTSGFSL